MTAFKVVLLPLQGPQPTVPGAHDEAKDVALLLDPQDTD
jgi:hypothetical protein